MIFINSKINNIPGSLIFQNFQNPSSKNLDFQIKMCVASKILPQGNTAFTEITVFKFHREQQFSAMLSQ